MTRKFQLRLPHHTAARIDELAQRKRATSSEIIRMAIDLGLQSLEMGRVINQERLLLVMEMAAAFSDIAAQAVDGKRAVEVPGLVLERLEKYHGKI
jgi:Arc/MetJ-type ribon-helix-helix transcriptional regulator